LLAVGEAVDNSPGSGIDDGIGIAVASPTADGILAVRPIYHFRRQSFDHIPAQDSRNLMLARSFYLITSLAVGNRLFPKSLSGKYELSLTSPFPFNFVRCRSIPLNEAQKRF
jgi:hypothetical protein